MKNKIITIAFSGILIVVFFLNTVLADNLISKSERRKLLQISDLSWNLTNSEKFANKFEKYMLDQMLLRDFLRTIKTFTGYYLFSFYDQHDVFIKDGYMFKIEYPYKKERVKEMAQKINYINDTYLEGMNIFYSVIPNKNYFLSDNNNYLSIDYNDLLSTLENELENIIYLPVIDDLSLNDYYRTDLHWRQENISKTADKLIALMKNDCVLQTAVYHKNQHFPFHGSYYSQAPIWFNPDTLVYLNNEMIDNAEVLFYRDIGENPDKGKIYDTMELTEVDSYDIFLSGAEPIIEIINNDSLNNEELIIFRDSFASSLAPLMLYAYSKITLIDLRYINSELVGDYVDFTNQDILFMYNTSIINNSTMIK